MQTQQLTISVAKAFGNLYRNKCVLVAATNKNGKVLVGAKPYFFPQDITRLLGGGVDEGETFEQAAVRELSEELGIQTSEEDLIPLVTFVTNATDESGGSFRNETAIYGVDIGDQPYQAGDDVKHIEELTLQELHELGEKYDNLPQSLWYKGEEGPFCWADYAKLYGPVHKLTAEHLQKLRS